MPNSICIPSDRRGTCEHAGIYGRFHLRFDSNANGRFAGPYLGIYLAVFYQLGKKCAVFYLVDKKNGYVYARVKPVTITNVANEAGCCSCELTTIKAFNVLLVCYCYY